MQKAYGSGRFYCPGLISYLYKFLIPHSASASSNTIPIEKEMDGIPSITKLMILPDANPTIKKIFEIVAVRHKYGFKTPFIQSTAIPKYNPIVALKTCFKSTDSTLKSEKRGIRFLGRIP